MNALHVHESKWQEAVWKVVVITIVYLVRIVNTLRAFFKYQWQLLSRKRAVVEKS